MVRKLTKIDQMLLRMILKSKGQFIAVAVIIIVGVTIFTAMSMTSLNMEQTVESYYAENRFADLFIETAPVPASETERLADIDGVAAVNGRLVLDVPMVTDDLNERIELRMITTGGDSEGLCHSTLIEGRNTNPEGKEILLIQQFAEARDLHPGDSITVQIEGIRYDLSIAGVVASPEYIYLMENAQAMIADNENFGVFYVSEDFGWQAAGMTGSYNEFLFRYAPGTDEDKLIDEIGDELYRYGVERTTKKEDQLSNNMISEELVQLDSMSSSLPILFLAVAGLILIMMLGRMVKKDRVKIGILKATGYSNTQVMLHYVKYALAAGISGGALGSILGMILAGAMTQNYLLYYNIPLLKTGFYFSYIVIAMLLAFLICAFAGVAGARGVMKIAPADAMRAESPKKGKRILLEKASFFWKRLSFSQKMTGKNIFRNKKRTLFVLTGVILTYALMVFTTSMPDVIDQMMNRHFEEFQRMDYTISFSTPVDKSVLPDMKHIVDVTYMEGMIEYPFELANGNREQSVSIIGLSRDTKFYSFQDLNKKPIAVPERGILLSENLANFLGLSKGDSVQVKSYLPNREDEYLTVKGVVKQTLGMNAYMEIDLMGRLLLDENIVTGIWLNSDDEKINEKLIKASNVATIMSVNDTRALYAQFMTLMNVYIGFMVLFSGILGFCIVYNATIISIGEREMEFSSLRVMGFTKSEIFRMILRENNLIAIAGIFLGIPVGKLFSEYSTAVFSTKLYTIDMTPTLAAACMACVYTMGFVLLAQLATYRKINRLDFLQALKNREA